MTLEEELAELTKIFEDLESLNKRRTVKKPSYLQAIIELDMLKAELEVLTGKRKVNLYKDPFAITDEQGRIIVQFPKVS